MTKLRILAAAMAFGCTLAPAAGGTEELPLPTDGRTVCLAAGHRGAPVPDGPVTAVSLSLEDGEYGFYFWLAAEFRDRSGEGFVAGGTCRHDDGRFVCPIDGDGGWFHLEPAPGGGVRLRSETGLRLESIDREEDDPSYRTTLRTEHLLVPVPRSTCP